MITEFQHPELGPILGQVKGGLIQFLGVKYASLKDRLAEPLLISGYPANTIEATKLGPQALSKPTACDDEHVLFQQSLPHDPLDMSDLECLHLNITAPEQGKNLPVFVFIHGGGFEIGSNAWPQYDHWKLVKRALNIGMPFIGVGVNYRVGVPGFLTSAELQNVGYKANNGIRDQRTSLMWVQKFISGFGGDPTKVTLTGQSAGAVSAMLHLTSSPSLFSQMVLMSGSTFVVQPLTPSVAEESYHSVSRALALDRVSADARLSALVQMKSSDLYEKIPPGVPLLPVVDGELVIAQPDYSAFNQSGIEFAIPGVQIYPRILIGDCRFDGHIFSSHLAQFRDIQEEFHMSLIKSLGSASAAHEVEDAYEISATLPPMIAMKRIVQFLTDIGFFAPAVTLARKWPVLSFLYHFNEPNSWNGPWKGETTHCLDVVYLFQNFNEHLSQEQRVQAENWARAIIKFVDGQEPFPSCQSEPQGAMVFGPPTNGSAFVIGDNLEDVGRHATIFHLGAKFGLDKLNDAMHAFISGH